ncbi:uncharacterized protein LOC126786189 isoform X2 [Argentina anserina]|uniref:uncharacterized protein LOC126786189 isoform X2 n=1 Tax=Argentina anserina TaxID=57926 RepID=UPI0021766A3E|nr:uncharacterized protein LOC126786189 isoform X2 [Potentilla anserina]
MAKSSSSHRKKRDKISSKARTKKKSKTRSKTKSEKYRSKKVRRRDDSISYSDEDDTRSLSSDSSFSSEDRQKGRRGRSSTRRDVKGSKKRGRKRSYSSDSREGSVRPRVKRRKGTKKGKEYKAKKRSRSREKPRRNVKTSSVSSGSWSCSTCQGGGISGDEIESNKTHRGRSEKRVREETDRNKVESGTERSRYMSRSCSLRSRDSESDPQSLERVSGERNGRRLRSVIAVTEEDYEGRWLDGDGHKEEITYDPDDYPSCRSNDSNDGGSKRELDNHLHVPSEVRMRVESAKEESSHVSNAQIVRLPSSGNLFERRDGEGQMERIDSSCDGTRIADHVDENKITGEISILKDNDLETVLRQKALENLKRFRGKPQRIAVTGNKEYEKQPSGVKAELVQMDSFKVGGAGVVVVKPFKEDTSINEHSLVEETNGSPVSDSICSSEISEKEAVKKNGRNETVSAKQDVAHPTHQDAIAGSSRSTAVVDKSNLAAPKSMSRSLKPNSILKRALSSLEPPRDRLSVTVSGVDNSASGAAQTVNQSSDNVGLDINSGSGSTGPEPSGENRSDIQQDEAKDGSQFEQKTMSVMRGSEVVQVSYKVYIPKKTPALARRQLKR